MRSVYPRIKILKERLTMGEATRYAAACSRNAVKRREDPRIGYTPVPDGEGTFRVEQRGPVAR